MRDGPTCDPCVYTLVKDQRPSPWTVSAHTTDLDTEFPRRGVTSPETLPEDGVGWIFPSSRDHSVPEDRSTLRLWHLRSRTFPGMSGISRRPVPSPLETPCPSGLQGEEVTDVLVCGVLHHRTRARGPPYVSPEVVRDISPT